MGFSINGKKINNNDDFEKSLASFFKNPSSPSPQVVGYSGKKRDYGNHILCYPNLYAKVSTEKTCFIQPKTIYNSIVAVIYNNNKKLLINIDDLDNIADSALTKLIDFFYDKKNLNISIIGGGTTITMETANTFIQRLFQLYKNNTDVNINIASHFCGKRYIAEATKNHSALYFKRLLNDYLGIRGENIDNIPEIDFVELLKTSHGVSPTDSIEWPGKEAQTQVAEERLKNLDSSTQHRGANQNTKTLPPTQEHLKMMTTEFFTLFTTLIPKNKEQYLSKLFLLSLDLENFVTFFKKLITWSKVQDHLIKEINKIHVGSFVISMSSNHLCCYLDAPHIVKDMLFYNEVKILDVIYRNDTALEFSSQTNNVLSQSYRKLNWFPPIYDDSFFNEQIYLFNSHILDQLETRIGKLQDNMKHFTDQSIHKAEISKYKYFLGLYKNQPTLFLKYDDLKKLENRAHELEITNPQQALQIYFQIGLRYFRKENFEKAIYAFSKLAKKSRQTSKTISYKLFICHFKLGNNAETYKYYFKTYAHTIEDLRESEPLPGPSIKDMMDFYQRLPRNISPALENQFNDSLNNLLKDLNNKVEQAFHSKEYVKALDYYFSLERYCIPTSLHKPSLNTHYQIGLCYFNIEKPTYLDKAIKKFIYVLEELVNNLAATNQNYNLLLQDKIVEALTMTLKKTTRPLLKKPFDRLACVAITHYQNKKFQLALESFLFYAKLSLALPPANQSNLNYNIGRCYMHLNDAKNSKKYLTLALEGATAEKVKQINGYIKDCDSMQTSDKANVQKEKSETQHTEHENHKHFTLHS